jgi:hypothetical protein
MRCHQEANVRAGMSPIINYGHVYVTHLDRLRRSCCLPSLPDFDLARIKLRARRLHLLQLLLFSSLHALDIEEPLNFPYNAGDFFGTGNFTPISPCMGTDFRTPCRWWSLQSPNQQGKFRRFAPTPFLVRSVFFWNARTRTSCRIGLSLAVRKYMV